MWLGDIDEEDISGRYLIIYVCLFVSLFNDASIAHESESESEWFTGDTPN